MGRAQFDVRIIDGQTVLYVGGRGYAMTPDEALRIGRELIDASDSSVLSLIRPDPLGPPNPADAEHEWIEASSHPSYWSSVPRRDDDYGEGVNAD